MPLPLRAEIKVVRQHTHLIFIFKEQYKTFCFKVDKTLHENLCSHILLSFSWRVNITYEESEIYIISVWEYKIKGIPGIKWHWGMRLYSRRGHSDRENVPISCENSKVRFWCGHVSREGDITSGHNTERPWTLCTPVFTVLTTRYSKTEASK